MKNNKSLLRKKFLTKRKKKFLKAKDFNFSLLFGFIKKHFKSKKIIIAGYSPSDYEVNIKSFLEKASKYKYNISLPVIKSSSNMSFIPWRYKDPLQVNKFGILEPAYKKKEIIPDLIMVPLVAFDNDLNRIGYGKGYYDRMLKKISKYKKKTIFLGIAYSFQRCSKIPVNKYDFKLDYIFTERGIISSN